MNSIQEPRDGIVLRHPQRSLPPTLGCLLLIWTIPAVALGVPDQTSDRSAVPTADTSTWIIAYVLGGLIVVYRLYGFVRQYQRVSSQGWWGETRPRTAGLFFSALGAVLLGWQLRWAPLTGLMPSGGATTYHAPAVWAGFVLLGLGVPMFVLGPTYMRLFHVPGGGFSLLGWPFLVGLMMASFVLEHQIGEFAATPQAVGRRQAQEVSMPRTLGLSAAGDKRTKHPNLGR